MKARSTKINWKRIADAVEAHATALPDEAPELEKPGDYPYPNGPNSSRPSRPLPRLYRTLEHTSVTIDNLTLRFPASRPAALAVAAKYRKGKAPRASWTTPKLGSMKAAAFSQATLNRFIEDREYENAEAYADLHARPVYYMNAGDAERGAMIRDAEPLPGDARFIVGRSPNGGATWRVTHIASGKAATPHCSSKADALAKFRAVDPDTLEAALAKTEPLKQAG